MELNGWQAQLRKGAAELVVLAVLSRGEAYGLEILERAQAAGDLVAEGALYQLLNRLEREGKLAARWQVAGPSGHPRKYYALTAEGRRLFGAMQSAWGQFHRSMSQVMEEAR
jgi:PadR family transcriptional regulator, regulatory protein PadR